MKSLKQSGKPDEAGINPATGKTLPCLPTYDKMVVDKLAAAYPNARIRYTNTAVGGKTSQWGIEEAEERVMKYQPDLVYLRFGMNDGSDKIAPEVYAENMRKLVRKIRRERPETEFIIMGTELPNPDCKGWTGTHAELGILD